MTNRPTKHPTLDGHPAWEAFKRAPVDPNPVTEEEARAVEEARKALTPEVLSEAKRRGEKAKAKLDAERVAIEAYEAKQEKKRAAAERKRARDIAKGEELSIDPTSTWMAPLTTYAVAANRSNLKFGVLGPDGNPIPGKTATPDQVLAGLALKANVEIRGEDLTAKRVQRAADIARRKAGLPDLCETCQRPLSMGRDSLRRRDKLPHPWFCQRCVASRTGKLMSVEERRRNAAVLQEKLKSGEVRRKTGVQNSHKASQRSVRWWASLSHEERESMKQKLRAAKTSPELAAAIDIAKSSNCDGCGGKLGSSDETTRRRAMAPRPWLCRVCRPKTDEKREMASRGGKARWGKQ